MIDRFDRREFMPKLAPDSILSNRFDAVPGVKTPSAACSARHSSASLGRRLRQPATQTFLGRFWIILGAVIMFSLSGCYGNSIFPQTIWSAIDDDDGRAIESGTFDHELSKMGFWNRKTPLQYAFENGKRDAFRALLQQGADPDQFLSNKQTVTFLSASEPDSYWLKLVLAHGADPNLWTKTHRNNAGTPLAATFAYSDSPRSVENAIMLIDAGVHLNDTINHDAPPLMLFAMKTGWKVVLYLLEKGGSRGDTACLQDFRI
ncbi:ankyrin repeat domain-containing protein [Pirellulaceae bacterium SH449]